MDNYTFDFYPNKSRLNEDTEIMTHFNKQIQQETKIPNFNNSKDKQLETNKRLFETININNNSQQQPRFNLFSEATRNN